MSGSIRLAVCLVALVCTRGIWAQSPDAQTDENAPDTASAAAAPVAHVYVQTTTAYGPCCGGEMVYAVAANGKLTPVKGSPFDIVGDLEDGNGKYLFTIGPYSVFTFRVASNGAIDKGDSASGVSATDTRDYAGSECGYPPGQGSVLDHTGKYLYVQLSGFGQCAAWQTYEVESNGSLRFVGDDVYFEDNSGGGPVASSVPTISSNDKFGYGVFPVSTNDATGDFCSGGFQFCPAFSAFIRGLNGTLTQNTEFSHSDPVPQQYYSYLPYVHSAPQADPNGHLAVLMNQLDGSGFPDFLQLASYTINPSTGAISSKNTNGNMPNVGVGYFGYDDHEDHFLPMHMSPSGLLLALGGYPGLQIFHFNGAKPITTFGKVLLPDIDIDQLQWDKNNHLYALSYESSELYVYTVTPTSIKEAPGSPYHLPSAPYGVKGLIVTW
jgi:hypothetical protein